jgi:endonuclease-3
MPLVPQEERVLFTHLTIDHGRAVCTARRPYCERCALPSCAPRARGVPHPRRRALSAADLTRRRA